MPMYYYPNIRSYGGKYDFDHIQQTGRVDRFEKMKSVTHFNDNVQHQPVGHSNHGRRHKIRLAVVLFDQWFSLNEQMRSTKITDYTYPTNHINVLSKCLLCIHYEYTLVTTFWIGIESESKVAGVRFVYFIL